MLTVQNVGLKSVHNPLAISGSTRCRGDHHLEMSLGALFSLPSFLLFSLHKICMQNCPACRRRRRRRNIFRPLGNSDKRGAGLAPLLPPSFVEKAASASKASSSCSSVSPSVRLPAPLAVRAWVACCVTRSDDRIRDSFHAPSPPSLPLHRPPEEEWRPSRVNTEYLECGA